MGSRVGLSDSDAMASGDIRFAPSLPLPLRRQLFDWLQIF
jgi:hypothetical protein